MQCAANWISVILLTVTVFFCEHPGAEKIIANFKLHLTKFGNWIQYKGWIQELASNCTEQTIMSDLIEIIGCCRLL